MHRPVPLLVVRLPQFERVAWRDGRRMALRVERQTSLAIVAAAARSLRAGDVLGHDPGSDRYVIVMTGERREAPSQTERLPSAVDVRAALERVAAAVACACDLRVESGWTLVRGFDPQIGLERDIQTALERGARERERYEFFATVGHELRTPLTSISGYLETLLDRPVDPPTQRRFLETARREALRLGRLLDGMFEFSLLDLTAAALIGSACEVREQLRRACEIVRPLAGARGIVLQWGAPPALRVALDADACLQIAVNLLDNALKYGRERGIVRAVARSQGAFACIVVDDDGPGIAPEERSSIFGLRVRGSRAGARRGSGIGLAIVAMIVERAGGEVRASDSPLGGARFEVVLPLRAESEGPAS